MIAIHIRLHTYDPLQPFAPWIHAIARYKFLDYLRRIKCSFKDIPPESSEELSAGSDLAAVESSLDLQSLMSSISSKARAAIQCVRLEGLSVSKAAAKRGMSESAVKVAVHRGLKALALLISEERNVNIDQLIDVLSSNPEPVQSGHLGKTLILAMVTGSAAAFGLMLVTVGPRPELHLRTHLEWVAVKLLFALSVIATGAPFLIRAMRPGRENETNWALIFFPFLAALAVALAMLLLDPLHAWRGLLLGAKTWSSARCLLCTMFFCCDPIGSLDPGAS